MLKLHHSIVNKSETYINTHCRDLENARFQYLFKNGSAQSVARKLKFFQNADGGFGKGLEPDFWLPDSSPLASSLAFQFIDEIHTKIDESIIVQGIQYFEKSFIPNRHGWISVPQEVNNYPHAPWWEYNEVENGTVIDKSWGNPTAQILGYLYKYRNLVNNLDVGELIENALQYLRAKKSFTSEHELYCFIRLAEKLPQEMVTPIKDQLISGTNQLVNFDKKAWNQYTPQPTHFASSPDHFLYEAVKKHIDTNLDYLIETVNEDGIWSPTWSWGKSDKNWKKARIYWQGILTIKHLQILSAFERIDW